MNVKTTIASTTLAAAASGYAIANWQAGTIDATRKSYNTVETAAGEHVSNHSDLIQAIIQAGDRTMQTKQSHMVRGADYLIEYTNPDIIDLGPIELREAGGILVIDGVDIVTTGRPVTVLDGTAFTDLSTQATHRGRPRVVLAVDSNEPIHLKMFTRAENAAEPERVIYEHTVTPSLRDWPELTPTDDLPYYQPGGVE